MFEYHLIKLPQFYSPCDCLRQLNQEIDLDLDVCQPCVKHIQYVFYLGDETHFDCDNDCYDGSN